MVSHIEFCLPDKPPTLENNGEGLKVPQRQLWKEALFLQYDKNKTISLILGPVPIKPLPEGTKFLRSLVASSIKSGKCSDACKFSASQCANGSPNIKGIGFYQYYSTVAHSDSFRTSISIAAMHRLTDSILDVSNAFQNTNVPIHERVCVIPPPYYLDLFEIL